MLRRGGRITRGNGDYTDDFGSFDEVTSTAKIDWEFLVPRDADDDSCCIAFFCHGAGTGYEQLSTGATFDGVIQSAPFYTRARQTIADLLERNYIVMMSSHEGANTFGGGRADGTGTGSNMAIDTAIAQIEYLRLLPEARTDVGALLFTHSMGNLTAMKVALDQPTYVAGIYAMDPLCDAEWHYDNDTVLGVPLKSVMNECHHLNHPAYLSVSSRGTGVNAANWGVGSTYDPLQRATAGDLDDIPWVIDYALDDTVINVPDEIDDFLAQKTTNVTVYSQNNATGHQTWGLDATRLDAFREVIGHT